MQPLRTWRSLRSVHPRRTDLALWSGRPLQAHRSGRPGRARRPGQAKRALEAREPLQSLRPRRSLRANRPGQPVLAGSARKTGAPLQSSLARLAGEAARSRRADVSGRSLWALSTRLAGRSGRTGKAREHNREHARGKVRSEQRSVLDLVRADRPRRDLVCADGVRLDGCAVHLVVFDLGGLARFSPDPCSVPGRSLHLGFRSGRSIRPRRFVRRDGDEGADADRGSGGGGR